MAEAGGRAVERKLTLPITPTAPMIGVKPLFTGKLARRWRHRKLRRDHGRARRQAHGRRPGCTGSCCESIPNISGIAATAIGSTSRSRSTRRVADGTIDVSTPTSRARIAVPVTWGRYRLEVTTGDPHGPETTFGFDAGWYAEASADTPDLLEIALDKPEYRAGRHHDRRGHGAHRRRGDARRDRRQAPRHHHGDVEPAPRSCRSPVGDDWGTGAYVLAHSAASARR